MKNLLLTCKWKTYCKLVNESSFFLSSKDISKQCCSSAIREVEDDLQKILRSSRPKQEDRVRDPETEKQHEEAGALFSRLRFVRLLYQGLAALSRHEVTKGQKWGESFFINLFFDSSSNVGNASWNFTELIWRILIKAIVRKVLKTGWLNISSPKSSVFEAFPNFDGQKPKVRIHWP
jgi:hypothetical protein